MIEPTERPAPSQVPPAGVAPAGNTAIAGGAMGIGTAVAASATLSNLFGALITIALAHTYSGAQFGALAALLSVGLVVAVPATGLQYVVARRTARAGLRPGQHDRTSLRLAAVLGAGLAGLVCLLSPLLAGFLTVSTTAVVFVGLSVAPYMINAAQLGTLLAQPRLGRFAVGQATLAGLRFAGVAAAILAGADAAGVMLALLVATALAVLCCVPLTGRHTWTSALPADARFVRELLRAAVALAGMSVVLNLDILLARHYLSAAESGVYALGALFAKAAMWAAQFVPQLIFARLAQDRRPTVLLRRAVTADLAVGLLVLLCAIGFARPVLDVVSDGGADPVAAAQLAPWFALLGTGWAVCYLVLLAAVATQDPRPSQLLWITIVLETVAVAVIFHDSALQILATMLVGTTVCAAVSVAVSVRPTGVAHHAAARRPGTA